MSGVILQPRFRVTEYAAVTGSRYVSIEMDDFQTAVMLTKPQARRLAKSLNREAAK
jgi:hypothetical protein